MKKARFNEFNLINQLTHDLPKNGDNVIKGVGDDCAVIKYLPGKYLLTTCDVQVDGVHFLSSKAKPEHIGAKSVAVNVSDIAAMGGKPILCMVSLIIPNKFDVRFIDGIYKGIKKSCRLYGVQIIGGNISSGKQLSIDIFMIGEINSDELILRSGAKIGDKILVTGLLGEAAAGLELVRNEISNSAEFDVNYLKSRQFTPTPRLLESSIIAKSKLATSMIDISDGLLSDVSHICQQSNVGAVIYESQIPLSDDVMKVEKQFGKKPLTFALSSGEDYELLFTAPSNRLNELIKMIESKTAIKITVIGEIVDMSDGMSLRSSNGIKYPLNSNGWSHL